MGVANTKSTALTNADQDYPPVLSAPYLIKGAMFCGAGQLAVLSADSNGSVYRFCRVPSGARIHSMKIYSDAISGFTSATIGLYNQQNNAGTQGTAVSAALFGSGVDLSKAQTEPYDVIFNNLGIANIEKRVWELLGLTADPFIFYDICIVGTTMSSGSGNLAMAIDYTI